MNRYRAPVLFILAVLALSLPVLACGWLRPGPVPALIVTPAPALDAATSTPAGNAILPTVVPRATETPAASPTVAVRQATPTEVVAMQEAMPTAVVAGPNKVVVTDADVAAALSSGIASQNGLNAELMEVHFTGGTVRITAGRLSYGLIQVSNLLLVGRLAARDGVLQMETESVSPSGIVTAMLPTLVNQALRQFGSQWFVEDVHVSEGQIELTVR